MAYDSVRGVTYLFGGVSDSEGTAYPSSLWTWDGSNWSRIAETGPPGREDAALAFDVSRNRLVLYGGRARSADGMTFFTDTWEWDGSHWTRADTTGAGKLVHAVATYDPQRRRVVLFGGSAPRTDEMNTRLWEWDGVRWSSRQTTIGNMLGVNDIFYSHALGALVAHTFRSSPELRNSGLLESDVWTLRDTTWQRAAAGPSFSPLAPAVLHQASGTMIVFAGFEPPPQTAAAVWLGAGNTWTRATGPVPTRRKGAAMVYDSRRKRVVLTGGDDDTHILKDVWEWDGAHWTVVNPADRSSR
jgi:hypothetical protein